MSKKADISRKSVLSRAGIDAGRGGFFFVDDIDVLDGVAVAVKGAGEGYRFLFVGFAGSDWLP